MGCIVVYELKFYIVASRQTHFTIKEKLTKNQVGHFYFLLKTLDCLHLKNGKKTVTFQETIAVQALGLDHWV